MSEILQSLFPGKVLLQYKVPSGIIDAVIAGDNCWVLVEIKRTLSIDAYDQLQRYSKDCHRPVSRVIIAKNCGPIAFPEQPSYLRNITDLKALAPGFYVLPFTSKGRTK